ncbi:sugar transferase [Pediococcus argentinicus]
MSGVQFILDFFLSLIALIILSPFLLVISIAIIVDDPDGGVIYSQVRLGIDGKKFRMYKFRSMIQDAEKKKADLLKKNEIDGPMFKMKNDPRITRVGKFIRKYSLDELPQLWNVLKGDMSLVGPRPPLPKEVQQYSIYNMQRLFVKPGCTGLWQVSGRNDVDFAEMVELDLSYIQKSSILFDLSILLRTLIVFVKPNGAY